MAEQAILEYKLMLGETFQRTAKENTSQLTAFLPFGIIIPQQYFEFKPTQHGT